MDQIVKDYLRSQRVVILTPIIFLTFAMVFRESLYGIFQEKNYVAVHLILETFATMVSFAIAMHAWMIFPHTLSNHRLWMGALFFGVGWIELLHMITYKGMPFFIMEASPYQATWFYMVSRLTQAIVILFIVLQPKRKVQPKSRWFAYGVAFLYSFFWALIIFYPVQLLPQLVIDGVGTTPLKNNGQYFIIAIQALTMVILLVRHRLEQVEEAMLFLALMYLCIGDSMFTSYRSVFDITNFIGHLFQVTGFFFLIRSLYYTSVEMPFEFQKAAEGKLRYFAYHDELTRLPNKRYFEEKLDEWILDHPRDRAAIVSIDIERLKNINDSLGHDMGDQFLIALSHRLRESLPNTTLLSRKRGDEFILLWAPLEHEEEMSIASRILKCLDQPIKLHKFELKPQVCLGISLYPEDGGTRESLMKNADIALHQAKELSTTYQFYHKSINAQALDHLVLENELYRALENHEFHLHYQPQVDIQTGSIIGVEALIRWNHPKRGWISPGQFIPLAERSGLIIPIGEWVIREACRQVKQWHLEGFPLLRVAVNLSVRQFYQNDLVEMIKGILEEYHFPATCLEIEITESMTINMDYAEEALTQLKALGIQISVDDFGTGYSSLSYLKKLHADRLKIDQSFIHNLKDNQQDAAIVSMIISIAQHLQMEVVAEGVETMDQFSMLREKLCQQSQGYFISKPLPPERFIEQFHEIEERIKEQAQKVMA